MGTQYVDDHRFLLYQGSTVTDITEAVSSPEARDELSALSVELTFTAVRNNNRDKYMHWYNIRARRQDPGGEPRSGSVLRGDPHGGAGRDRDSQRPGLVPHQV